MLPEIFAGFAQVGDVRADLLREEPAPSDPVEFSREWRVRARDSARSGKRVLAEARGVLWRLAGQKAVSLSGQESCDPGELAGGVLFVEGERTRAPGASGQVCFADDSDRMLYHALWPQHAHERPEADQLSGEADGPAGGLGWQKMRTLARLHGVRGSGLNEFCARFDWAEGETALSAGEALLEMGRLLADREAVYFSQDAASPRWLGGIRGGPATGDDAIPSATRTGLTDWARARAILAQAQVEADVQGALRHSAIIEAPLRQVIEDVGRLGGLADAIMPSDYVSEHERLVREGIDDADPQALAEHPHLLITLDDLAQAETSARPLISVRLGEDFVPEAIVPQPSGQSFVWRREDLYELGGADEIREMALVAWGRSLLESGVPPAQVASRLAPFCVPGGRPVAVAADGNSRWAIRPGLDAHSGVIRYTPCQCGGDDHHEEGSREDRFVAVCASAATYDEAIEALARSGAILPTAARDPVLRQILLHGHATPGMGVQPAFATLEIDGSERPVVLFGSMAVWRDGPSYAVSQGRTRVARFSDRAQAFSLASGMAGRTSPPFPDEVAAFCAHAGIDQHEELS